MKRIIIDSVALGSVLEEIEQDATMLNYLTDLLMEQQEQQ